MSKQGPILIGGLNWLGDALMSMPGLQAFREAHPGAELGILARPALLPLWEMTGLFQHRLPLPAKGLRPIRQAAEALRPFGFNQAFIQPASLRAALPPALARIPERVGFHGHFPRDVVLTRTLPRPPGNIHQALETHLLLGLPAPTGKPAYRLPIPPVLATHVTGKFADLPQPWIGIIPGAARGPSKQWPAERYAEAARRLAHETGGTPCCFGSTGEAELCTRVAAACGGKSFAGETTLPELAACLAACRLVLCNDSGGMHLAAMVGTPLIAMAGITDPARTGPLGAHSVVLQKSEKRSRDIPRESIEAIRALEAITVQDVLSAARPLLV